MATASNLAPANDLKDEVEQLLYRQSEFLDTRDWDGWLDLFTSTGIYWIPAHPDDPSPDGLPCICCEDRYLMRMRVKRLRNPKAWSQLPRIERATLFPTFPLLITTLRMAASTFNRVSIWWNSGGISSAIWPGVTSIISCGPTEISKSASRGWIC